MKKVVTLLCVLFLVGLSAQSTVAQILTEDFNYTVGSMIKNDTTTDGLGWRVHSGASTNNIMVVDSNLTLSGSGPEVYPSGGNAIYLTSVGQDINSRIVNAHEDSIWVNPVGPEYHNFSSGVLYASMLVSLENVGDQSTSHSAAGDYFFHFGDYGTTGATSNLMNTADFWGRVYVRHAFQPDSAIIFGIAKGALSTNSYPQWTDSTSGGYSLNTTYLLVVKYDFAGGDTSSANASLYVFKAGDDWTTEPGSPSAGPDYTQAAQFGTGFTSALEIAFVAFRQGTAVTAPKLVVDGLHVSDTWQSLNLPVELTAFNASVSGKSVDLAWTTATEINNSGFAVERKSAASSFAQVGFVAGNGTSNVAHHYSYADAVAPGSYTYRLKQVDHDGKFEYSKQIEATVGLTPADYALSQNYPNPFNPSTMITFAVPTNQKASMKVYNLLGQEVMTLFDGEAQANQLYHVQFNASSLSSGTYFYILQTGDTRQIKKMVLLK